MTSIQFLGAAGTVTGSKFVVEASGKRVMIDCGLFQGRKELRQRNWRRLEVPPETIDHVVLTHAHIDHTGYLPRLVRDGFKGTVWSTPATKDLAALMLPDSAHLQEEEAAYANKLSYSRHHPALPLYTGEDAKRALERFETIRYDHPEQIDRGLTVTFRPAGHILGSATVELRVVEKGKRPVRVVFTGDLGRYDAPVLHDPAPVEAATYLLVESTYGDREHGSVRPKDALKQAVNEAAKRGGAIVIPSFAIGRAQEILYHLRELEAENAIPVLPVFVDSPMASDATPLFVKHKAEHDKEMRRLLDFGARPFHPQRVHFTRSVSESKAINSVERCIILSASGMATGGRVLHHLAHRLPDPRNTVLFVGYQSEGTRGRLLQDGATELKMLGQMVPVRARIEVVSGFSAHADHNEMMRWLDGFSSPPEKIFCVHGEQKALAAMKARIEARGPGWHAEIPGHGETVELK